MENEKHINISLMNQTRITDIISTLSDGDNVFLIGRAVWNDGEPLRILASNVHIDARNAEIKIEQMANSKNDTVVHICPGSRNVHINGLYIKYTSIGDNTEKDFSIIKNCGINTTIENCVLDVSLNHQENIIGIFNDGEYGIGKQGEGLQVYNNRIYIYQKAAAYTIPSTSYGIYNKEGRCFCSKSNYLFIQNDGVGEHQRAIGIYNSGDSSVVDNNNIKGNGSHNVGTLVNKCHAYGAVDDSNNSTWCNNNIVGEWGGFCCGIQCNGKHTKVCHNKILATHTIKGSTVLLHGDHSDIYGNVITSTSRNPRLIEIKGRHCRVYENLLDAVLGTWDVYISACGIYVNKAEDCRISNNAIMVLKDCGIYCDECDVQIVNNDILENIYNPDYCKISDNGNKALSELLDESKITDYIPINS